MTGYAGNLSEHERRGLRLCYRIYLRPSGTNLGGLRANHVDYRRFADLLRWSSREVRVVPEDPVSDLLILIERLVGPLDRACRIRALISRDQNRQWLGSLSRISRDDRTIADLGLQLENSLEIIGVNIHSGCGDDDVLRPALEVQIAILVHFGNVAGVEPSIVRGGYDSAFPITRRDILAAHHDFSLLADLHFLARKRLSDRASPNFERVIHGYERSGLGHPVALNHREAE